MNERHAEPLIRWFEDLGSEDVAVVGGKNASLGEMIRTLKVENIQVPDGFATTAAAYREFLDANGLTQKIQAHLDDLQRGKQPLEKVGRAIRRLFARAGFPDAPRRPSAMPMRALPAALMKKMSMSPFAAAPRPRTCRRRALPGSRRLS